MRLIVENKSQEKTGEFARQLMTQARQELTDATLEEKVLEFIKAVVSLRVAGVPPVVATGVSAASPDREIPGG